MTARAEEAVVVPVPVFERDELGAADACDGLVASEAAFCEEFSKTISTVGLLISAGKTGASQACLTVRACEALSVPWFVLVCHSSTGDHLKITVKILFLASVINLVDIF